MIQHSSLCGDRDWWRGFHPSEVARATVGVSGVRPHVDEWGPPRHFQEEGIFTRHISGEA
jgi:hypothetical protein